MARFGMVIDTKKCVGCMDCVVACKTENDVPDGHCRDWITTEVRGEFPHLAMEIRSERCNHCDHPPCVTCCPTGASHVEEFGRLVQITAERCNHCDNPPCVTCCPTGASHVDEFGTMVQITYNTCIGCKACHASCPYDARFVHPDGYADKCTFCVHRVKEGLDPACVSVCPTHCMRFGDLDDPSSPVSRLLTSRPHHALLPAAGTEPRIFYLT